ncbi:MAG TPA: ABC transporter ATP-binding protein, partial [Gemmatales bacterium]|nr:ABC transporter ATP-binding protein [Gemmatales bacterium]
MTALLEPSALPTPTVKAARIAVRCQGLTKEYGTGDNKVMALSGIDVDINYGEMTLLVGPSGCGKTTLISLIAGLLNPTSGTIQVLDQELTKISSGKKTRFRGESVGFVFQQYNLLPALNAAENAAIPLIINGVDRRKAVKKATECLEMVGMGNRARSLPSQLSGGQQQRVAIARSLVIEPKLLVCDEPTAALDAKSGQTVMQLLRQVAVQQDRAVIVVTHDNRVFGYGDRIVEMEDGTVKRVY